MNTIRATVEDPMLQDYGLAVDRLEGLHTAAHQTRRREVREVSRYIIMSICATVLLQSEEFGGFVHSDKLNLAVFSVYGMSTAFSGRNMRRQSRNATFAAQEAVSLSSLFNVVPPVWALNEAR